MGGVTYKSAGVDLEVYEQSMARLPRLMHRTFSPRVMKLDGGFAGLFQLDFASRLFARQYREPVLVAGTDGVGTKLKVAQLAGKHDTVGIDLVAMCVNDVLCCGAEPLFFLDYVAMSHDDPARLEQIVTGVSNGCLQADCALLGGETAIMPDLYRHGDYDLAGFCVGVVEKANVITGKQIVPGDLVVGVGSSGVHSNGFSLVRKAVFEVAGLRIDEHAPELGCTVAETLLTPTRIYAAPLRQVLQHYRVKSVVHGVAHITGGGLAGNLIRIVPENVRVVLHRDRWPLPAVFPWIQQLGQISESEMLQVFNMGIGLAVVVSAYYADTVRRIFADAGYPAWIIGEAVEGKQEVAFAQS